MSARHRAASPAPAGAPRRSAGLVGAAVVAVVVAAVLAASLLTGTGGAGQAGSGSGSPGPGTSAPVLPSEGPVASASAEQPSATAVPSARADVTAATRAAPEGRGADAVPGPGGGPASLAPAPDVAPVALSVPAIDLLDAPVDRLGLRDDGSIEVPDDPDRTGWLTASAVPGERGPAVVAGHVDSSDGVAVFTRLGELAAGDEVTLRLEDGSDVTYRVTSTERYPKTEFPTDRVYGPAPGSVLRLITCGGSFDRDAGSYVDNVVVYAALVG